MSAPKDYYSIFLASLDTKKDAQSFVKKYSLGNKSIIVHSNSDKMIVMTGIYSNRTEALSGLSNLDNRLKKNKPFLQKIFRTQESYLKNNLNIDSSNESKKEEIINASILEKEKLAKEAKKAEELKLAKIAEEKRLARIAEEEARLAEQKKQEELAKKEKERLEKEKLAEELKKAEELKLAKIAEEKVKLVEKNQKVEIKKVVQTAYSKKLASFNNKFNKASKDNYTLKLITIKNSKVKWYTHRFGLDPYYTVIKNGNKSTIYYGVFNTVKDAKAKTDSLHPLISQSKPPVKKIGSIR